MTTLDATTDGSAEPPAHPEQAAPTVAGPLAGDPTVIGLPSFIVGSIALGLVLVGMVPATAVGASLPIGIFAGFWLSYAVLVLGLTHNWFGITATAATSTQELFLTSWLITVVMLTLATLRLPRAFTLVFALIDVALLLVLLSTVNASTSLAKAGGYTVLLFAAVGVYLFFSALSVATGGKPLPLGKPVLH